MIMSEIRVAEETVAQVLKSSLNTDGTPTEYETGCSVAEILAVLAENSNKIVRSLGPPREAEELYDYPGATGVTEVLLDINSTLGRIAEVLTELVIVIRQRP